MENGSIENHLMNITELPSLYSDAERYVIVLFMSVIFIAALIGNIVVIVVLGRDQALHSISNFYLLNLSVADLLVAIFFIGVTTMDLYVTEVWVFGDFLCRFVSFIQITSTTVSILTLSLIAIERYILICKPIDLKLSVPLTKRLMLSSWIISVVISSPQFYAKSKTDFMQDNESYSFCLETWPIDYARAYTVLYIFIFFVLPVCVMSLLYFKIAIKVKLSAKKASTNARRIPKASSKITKIFLLIMLSFSISWTPVHTVSLWHYFHASYPNSTSTIRVLAPILYWLAWSTAATNPLIYAFMNTQFQRSFKAMVRSSDRNSRSSQSAERREYLYKLRKYDKEWKRRREEMKLTKL